MRRRWKRETAEAPPLPRQDDPVWRLGHAVVEELARYLTEAA